MHMFVKVSKVDENATIPEPIDDWYREFTVRSVINCIILPGERKYVPIGLKINAPPGYDLEVRSIENLAANTGLIVMNAPGKLSTCVMHGTRVLLLNTDSTKAFTIKISDRIANIILVATQKIAIEEL